MRLWLLLLLLQSLLLRLLLLLLRLLLLLLLLLLRLLLLLLLQQDQLVKDRRRGSWGVASLPSHIDVLVWLHCCLLLGCQPCIDKGLPITAAQPLLGAGLRQYSLWGFALY